MPKTGLGAGEASPWLCAGDLELCANLQELPHGSGEPTGELMKVTLLSDASHAPQGLRGCQGILALWGGALVQWESKRQPFAALSSTEAELIGYVDSLTMGESLQVILTVLEHNQLIDHGRFEIKGDNLSGIQLLHAPDRWSVADKTSEVAKFCPARKIGLKGVACGTCPWSRACCGSLDQTGLCARQLGRLS